MCAVKSGDGERRRILEGHRDFEILEWSALEGLFQGSVTSDVGFTRFFVQD